MISRGSFRPWKMSALCFQVAGIAEHPDAMGRVVQSIIQHHDGHQLHRRGRHSARPAKAKVDGLTTAATVGVTAALGIACGLAAWDVVATGALLTLVLLVMFGWPEKLLPIKKINGRSWQRSLPATWIESQTWAGG